MRSKVLALSVIAVLAILVTGAAIGQGGFFTLQAGASQDVACAGGGELVLNRPFKLSDGSADRSLGRLRCKPSAAPTEPPEPTATATATPAPTTGPVEPTATATAIAGIPAAPDWTYAAGMTGEYGMAPATYAKIAADAATGAFDRECTAAEHDPTQWHTLINYAAGCHYDHMHGDNPHAVNDIFGPVGASFGVNQSISYPWQTYAAGPDGSPVRDPDGSLALENEYKHAGYFWVVRRGQCANGDPSYCVDAFRIQVHASVMGRATRWHSYSAEIRACTDGRNPATCNNAQIGGWIDTFALFAPNYTDFSAGALCDNAFNAAYFGDDSQINDFGMSGQFYPRNDPDLQDEQRCHRRLPAGFVQSNPNGAPYGATAPAEWWHHTPWDFRYNVLFYDPFAETDRDGNLTMYCAAGDASCRWTQSRFTLNVDYVFPVMSWHAGFAGWVTPLGDYGQGCTEAGPNCIWADYSRVSRNPGDLGYLHTRDGEGNPAETQPFDHDITPAGRPSWIDWFRMPM